MPGLPGDSGDMLFIFWIAYNKTKKRGMAVQPDSLFCFCKGFSQLHLYCRTGHVQSKAALMFAGSRRSNRRFSCKNFFLAAVRAVTGYAVQIQSFGAAAGDQLQSGEGCFFFQKTLRLSGNSIKGQSDINQMLRYKIFRKRILPVNENRIIFVHKNPPLPFMI